MTPDQLAKSGTEHAHQRALFAWANMACEFGLTASRDERSYIYPGVAIDYRGKQDRIPQLKWLHAIHNQGHGDAIRGSKAKAEGVKAGVWDIFLPVPIIADAMMLHWWHGLYIEMKVGKNQLTKEQLEFMTDLSGYNFAVCYSWQEARDAILKYLDLD